MAETRGKGQVLGDIAFFFRLRHLYTAVVADTSSTLFTLARDDYEQLCASYVDDADKAMEAMISVVDDSGKAGKSQGSHGESVGTKLCWSVTKETKSVATEVASQAPSGCILHVVGFQVHAPLFAGPRLRAAVRLWYMTRQHSLKMSRYRLTLSHEVQKASM